eukprot:Awhi_evm1s13956
MSTPFQKAPTKCQEEIKIGKSGVSTEPVQIDLSSATALTPSLKTTTLEASNLGTTANSTGNEEKPLNNNVRIYQADSCLSLIKDSLDILKPNPFQNDFQNDDNKKYSAIAHGASQNMNFQSVEQYNQMSMLHDSSQKIMANQLEMSRNRVSVLANQVFELKSSVLQEQNEKSEVITTLKSLEIQYKEAILETQVKYKELINKRADELAQREIDDLQEYIQSLKMQREDTRKYEEERHSRLQNSLLLQKKEEENRVADLR